MTLQLPPTDEQIARMRREVLTTIAVRRTRRRRRFWWVAGATALVLAASTAGVAALFASVDDRNVTFDCYTSTDLTSNHSTSTSVETDRDKNTELSMADRVATALAVCEASYTAVRTGEDAPAGPYVPNPTACVLSDRRIAVLPNAAGKDDASFCVALGLTAPVR
jgi:hypothetical protein